mgnify:CR=1 FL=1
MFPHKGLTSMISISAFRTLMKDPRSLISTGSPNGATRVTSKRVLGRTPKEKSFFRYSVFPGKKPFTTPLCPGFISRSYMMFSYWKMRTTFISAATSRFTAILASPTARRRGPFCAEVITEATLPTYKPKSRRRFNSLGGIFPSFAILHCTFIGSWIRR